MFNHVIKTFRQKVIEFVINFRMTFSVVSIRIQETKF